MFSVYVNVSYIQKNIISAFITTHCYRLKFFDYLFFTRCTCDIILRFEAKMSNVRVNFV